MHRHSETLARLDMFRDVDAREINRLNTQCVWRRIDAGTEILSHQDTSSDVYFVVAGTVRVIIPSVLGRDTIFRDIQAGDFFGELAAIDGKERSASIVAMTNATIATAAAARMKYAAADRGLRVMPDLLGARTAPARYARSAPVSP